MELVLALDLRLNTVVHGKSGMRATYKPLDWGLSPTVEPVGFVQAVKPKYLYIADLDRIEEPVPMTIRFEPVPNWLNAVMLIEESRLPLTSLPAQILKMLSALRLALRIFPITMGGT